MRLVRPAAVLGGGEGEHKVSVLVVSFQTREHLRACLASLMQQRCGFGYDVWVVDNASQDGSAKMVRADFPNVGLLQSSRNVGFAAANLAVFPRTKGELVLLFNSDAVASPTLLAELVRFMEESPNAAAVGPKLVHPDGSAHPSVRRFPTLLSVALSMSYAERLWPRWPIIRSYRMADFSYDHVAAVDQIMGACMLMRRQAIDEVGFLDSQFFMYFEEVDWCLRARQAGWQIFFTPEAKATHVENASSRQYWSETQGYYHESMVRFFRKHHGAWEVRALKALLAAGMLFRLPVWGAMHTLKVLPAPPARQRLDTYGKLLRALPRW